jgi:peptidoglycan/xylan/chitin deacetylase (PgdA/CDA1 family)
LISAALPAALLLGAHAAPATALLPRGRLLFPTTTRVEVEGGAVALTFDDGPDAGLGDFLDLLEDAGARATFFVVGEQVERLPEAPREIVSRGHEVALHCHRHRNHLRLTPGQTVEDMRRARATIEDAAGRAVRLFRPPYGVFNAASWREAGRQGWTRVLWSRWGRDWEAWATPGSVVSEIGVPEAGDVLLLHDSDRYAAPGSTRATRGALPAILERLSARGIRVLPVGELLGAGER